MQRDMVGSAVGAGVGLAVVGCDVGPAMVRWSAGPL